MSAKIFHADLYGRRADKYQFLGENDLTTTEWTELEPNSPFYFFVPRDESARKEYETAWQITEIFPTNTSGIVTARDAFVLDFENERLLQRMQDMRSESLSDQDLREKYFANKGSTKYPAGDSRGWKLPQARELIRADSEWEKRITPCLYRPFDLRALYYCPWMVDWPRPQVMRHMLAGENVGLSTTRSIEIGRGYEHIFCTRHLATHHTVSIKEVNYLFPLYLYPDPEKPLGEGAVWPAGKNGRRPNLNPDFVRDMETRLGMKFVTDGKGNLNCTAAVPAAVPGASRPRNGRQDACDTAGEDAGGTTATFGPEDIFNYIYAVFHSPTFRERYAEFLKIDFPRLPLTPDPHLFATLCALGAELAGLHLMESPDLDHLITSFPVPGSHFVEKGHPKYLAPGDPEPGTGNPLKCGRVYISKDNTKTNTSGQYFDSVPPEVWAFHVGGYQVCEKWLKDRRSRALSHDDLQHYQKIIVALKETIRLMGEIDAAIPNWPIK